MIDCTRGITFLNNEGDVKDSSQLAAPPDFKALPRFTPQIRPHNGATTPTSHRPAASPSVVINASFGLAKDS